MGRGRFPGAGAQRVGVRGGQGEEQRLAGDFARVEIRQIRAVDTHPLRQAVLRPHQRLDEVAFEGDDAADAWHVGAFANERLVAIATILPQRPEALPRVHVSGEEPTGEHTASALPGDWRLRGMATVPDARRRGLGRALVSACAEHAARRAAGALWCHARLGARPFYVALGFTQVGGPFELASIGTHVFMWRTP